MKLISIIVLISLLGLVFTASIADQETGVVDSNPSFHQSETETFVEKRHKGGRKNKKNKQKQASSSEEGK